MAVSLRKIRLRSVWLLVLPFFWFAAPEPGRLVAGAAVALLGLGLRGWAAGTIHKDAELTTGGPYAHTRNPLYLGSFLIGVGVATAGGHWIWLLLFLAFFAAVYTRTMAHEKEHLTGLFAEAYREYAERVPAFLPRLTAYRAGGGEGSRFRWSQYTRNREWEAALGVVSTFAFLAAKMVLLPKS